MNEVSAEEVSWYQELSSTIVKHKRIVYEEIQENYSGEYSNETKWNQVKRFFYNKYSTLKCKTCVSRQGVFIVSTTQ